MVVKNWKDVKITAIEGSEEISPISPLGIKYLYEARRRGSFSGMDVYFDFNVGNIDFTGFDDYEGELDKNPNTGRMPSVRPQSAISITLFDDQIKYFKDNKINRSEMFKEFSDLEIRRLKAIDG